MPRQKEDITVVPQLDRLKEMAEFLKTLDKDRFDFSHLVSECNGPYNAICGTICCAVGHMPTIWPDLFKWFRRPDDPDFAILVNVRRKDDPNGDRTDVIGFDLAQSFLGLTEAQTNRFFLPGPGGNSNKITSIELAEQIEAFILVNSFKHDHSPMEVHK